MSIKDETKRFAERITALGFRVFIAADGTYGFITDNTETRVLDFSIRNGSLGGCYGPPSRESGTGWRMEKHPWDLQTADDVRAALYANAPKWCGNGWKNYTGLRVKISAYGPSSKYEEYKN